MVGQMQSMPNMQALRNNQAMPNAMGNAMPNAIPNAMQQANAAPGVMNANNMMGKIWNPDSGLIDG